MAKKEEYMTLKEAAELSGYSADYVGQLIRQGKLPGKQVFSNVSWVTTESAIREYVTKKNATSNTKYRAFGRFQEVFANPEKVALLARFILWVVIVVSSILTIALLFVSAIGIDRYLEERSLQTVEYDH